MGGTSEWRICGLDPLTTLGVYFEVVNQVCFIVESHASVRVMLLTLSWDGICVYTAHIASTATNGCNTVHYHVPSM